MHFEVAGWMEIGPSESTRLARNPQDVTRSNVYASHQLLLRSGWRTGHTVTERSHTHSVVYMEVQ